MWVNEWKNGSFVIADIFVCKFLLLGVSESSYNQAWLGRIELSIISSIEWHPLPRWAASRDYPTLASSGPHQVIWPSCITLTWSTYGVIISSVKYEINSSYCQKHAYALSKKSNVVPSIRNIPVEESTIKFLHIIESQLDYWGCK